MKGIFIHVMNLAVSALNRHNPLCKLFCLLKWDTVKLHFFSFSLTLPEHLVVVINKLKGQPQTKRSNLAWCIKANYISITEYIT